VAKLISPTASQAGSTASSLCIETIPVSKINPAPYNPRVALTPWDPEYQKLQRSLDEFGLVEPLVWNRRTGTLVGGHQRFAVLVAQGKTDIPVSVVDLPIEREKALNLALNKITGRWDEDKLAQLLHDLSIVPEFDLALTGFEIPEAQSLIAEHILAMGGEGDDGFDMDAALAAAGPTVTKPGDLILLGRDPRTQHRLLCGDSTNPEDVRRLMNGERAALFATDPPYLVGYDGTNHVTSKTNRRKMAVRKLTNPTGKTEAHKDWSGTYGITWDDADANPDLYDKFCTVAIQEAIMPHAAWYCWYASSRHSMLEAVWKKHGVLPHCQIIWAKNRPILTRSWYTWQHEPCLMGWLQGKKPKRADKTVLSTLWQVPTLATGPDRPDHPTPKPLELFEIPMRQHTRGGDICYEPFAGSGTQIMAAQRLGRRCYSMEISPRYIDVIVRRFIAAAGADAVSPELAKKYRVTPVAAGVKPDRNGRAGQRGSAGVATPTAPVESAASAPMSAMPAKTVKADPASRPSPCQSALAG